MGTYAPRGLWPNKENTKETKLLYIFLLSVLCSVIVIIFPIKLEITILFSSIPLSLSNIHTTFAVLLLYSACHQQNEVIWVQILNLSIPANFLINLTHTSVASE